jgi:large subunit ribosomal protein L14
MIQHHTILRVSDNSGAKTVKCIKVLGGFRRKFAVIGDIIVVSIQQLRDTAKSKKNLKVKKKEIYKALIIRTKTKLRKKDGFFIYFRENSVALLNKQGKPIGTRIFGPIPKTLKKKFNKFLSISTGLI